ncbi:hypothetical protein [Paenibacillus oceani]|nr:hypothetical protein [Paenibacillus oceani]
MLDKEGRTAEVETLLLPAFFAIRAKTECAERWGRRCGRAGVAIH